MNIEDVCGIILYKDGVSHSFGVHKMGMVDSLDDENYHDTSFLMDIVSSDWFQKTGYVYQKNQNLRKQIMDMVGYGFSFLLNCSTLTASGDKHYIYTLQTPLLLSSKTKRYLSNIYSHLNEVILENDAFFFGEPYDRNGDYVWSDAAYSLDEFYHQMNISKKVKVYKK